MDRSVDRSVVDSELTVYKPILVTFGPNTDQINHAHALTTEGRVYSWGHNQYYHLGYISDSVSTYTPRLVIDVSNVIDVSIVSQNTYLLTSDGRLYFCGDG